MSRKKQQHHFEKQEVQDFIKLGNLSPKQWEKKIEMALRANGWDFFHDKDRPTRDKRILAARMPGHPDYHGWKFIEGLPHKALALASGYFKGNCTFHVWFECKTGQGQPTPRQLEVITAFNKTPAGVAKIVHPFDYDDVIAILGGFRP